ncbi:ribosome-associated protein [Mycoplasmoides fastidiosum]|uniref:Ribosome-associated protein n=1 Tax=Mycoplasmoides fastidiosum TaxID=92758 RepID=A0ABU0LYM3_9BACT|nr:RNA-binding S4 domain-containing protein [Mycoplasmoides fastidiosum]MDQ0513807.1 ribosome-associated protein [Mycoplasmoides fastidiosum]UUD37775.1 RNA-binding S4 domain-containing protein [Mycoplasmoides fastidiosum]
MQKILIKTPYITLGQFLKFSGIINSGNEAKTYIQKNKILINKIERTERGAKIYPNDVIEILNQKFLIARD